MHGNITHVSGMYSRTDCTTAKYIWTKVQAPDPSLLKTCVILTHYHRYLYRLSITSGQSLSSDKITLPRYPKEVTLARGIT